MSGSISHCALCTSVRSASEAFATMRYINWCFTYLLTYLLTISSSSSSLYWQKCNKRAKRTRKEKKSTSSNQASKLWEFSQYLREDDLPHRTVHGFDVFFVAHAQTLPQISCKHYAHDWKEASSTKSCLSPGLRRGWWVILEADNGRLAVAGSRIIRTASSNRRCSAWSIQ